jgi:chromosome segregation ATPase
MPANSMTTAGLKTSPAGRIDMRTVQERQKAGADRFKERSARAAEQTDKLQQLRGAWQLALQSKDIDTLKILNADFESAARESAQNTKDLSGMMFALLDGYKDIGVAIKAAEEFNTEEKKIMDDAAALVEDAKGSLVQAQAMQFNILGRRDRAIAAARSGIETAEAALKTTKQQNEAMRRERLNKMDLKQSMQLQQAITQELTDVAQSRIGEIEANLDAVQHNVNATMDGIKADTALLEGFDTKLTQANAELGTLNEELTSYTENSSEWQDCRDRILKKTRERDDIEAERNAAFMRTQEGQRFIEFNKIEEQGQIQLLAQHKNWISLLQLGTQQRDILYEVHLGLVRGAADQEAMSMIDQVATETDERMATDAGMKTQAMRKNTLDRLNRMPDQVRRLRQITETETQNQVEFERQFSAKIEEFHKNFGTIAGYDDRGAHRSGQPA